MAHENECLDYQGLEAVACCVNAKVAELSVMPADAADCKVAVYTGSCTGCFETGHTYQYCLACCCWTDVTPSSPVDVSYDPSSLHAQAGTAVAEAANAVEASMSSPLGKGTAIVATAAKWKAKAWTGMTSFCGIYVWSDGCDIYYSCAACQYVLDRNTSTWSCKSWSGLTSFYGCSVWSDGCCIYYSHSNTDQYVLDRDTSTWSCKSWTGLTGFNDNYIWSDGCNIYYSCGAAQCVLNKATSTWSCKTWTGLTCFTGSYIWTDGCDIYYNCDSCRYVLNRSTSTWSCKTWTGLADPQGNLVWTDGCDIYFSGSIDQYVLNRSTSTWSKKAWTGMTGFYGNYVWTDGCCIYYSRGASSCQCVLDKSKFEVRLKPHMPLEGHYGT